MERAQLIQRWFEREQRQLQDKQAWYQSNQVRAAGQDRTAKAQHTTMGARRVSPSPCFLTQLMEPTSSSPASAPFGSLERAYGGSTLNPRRTGVTKLPGSCS